MNKWQESGYVQSTGYETECRGHDRNKKVLVVFGVSSARLHEDERTREKSSLYICFLCEYLFVLDLAYYRWREKKKQEGKYFELSTKMQSKSFT